MLQDRTWAGHIAKGHPEVKNDRLLVERTIESPDEIRIAAPGRIAGFTTAPGRARPL